MKIRTLLFFLFFAVASVMPGLAEFTEWQDTDYDFSKVKTVYLSGMDTSEAGVAESVRDQKYKDDYRKKAGKIKVVKVVMAPREQPRALLPGETIPSEKAAPAVTKGADVVTIPQGAVDAKADIYILAKMTQCDVDSYLVPAHTEWKSRQVEENYVDKDGKLHSFYRTENYPEYVPDHDVPYVTVGVQFQWFDTKTGKLVASSEDVRRRNSENNPSSVYNCIIEKIHGQWPLCRGFHVGSPLERIYWGCDGPL